MEIEQSLLREDRDRQFEDWGETIIYRRVSQAVDTHSGELTELCLDTELTAIVGTQPLSLTKGTAGQHASVYLNVFIKEEEMPDDEPTTPSRILRGAEEFDIVKSSLSVAQIVRTLGCRKRN